MDIANPVKTFREGPIGASVWLRRTTAGVFYDVTFSRSWKDEETGRSGYANTFSDRHLAALIKVAGQAEMWIVGTKANAQTVTGDSHDCLAV